MKADAAFQDWIARARAVPIEDEAARHGIKLRGRRPHFFGPCPLCGEGVDRFGINTDKQMFYCRKCGVGGDVIELVERLDGVDFNRAVETLTKDDRPRAAPVARPTKTDEDEKLKYEAATRTWRDAQPAAGTLVETYLKSRCITIPPPPSLRFAPRLYHMSTTDTITYRPGMVALVQRGTDGAPIAIHRTYLSPAGGKAPVDPVKKALAATAGGAVRLAPAGDFLMVGEGIETCLAAMQVTGLPAWAALSTSGLRRLGLPTSVHRVTVLADLDDEGEGERAAQSAGERWLAEGREVRIARPPDGCDFNDLIAGNGR